MRVIALLIVLAGAAGLANWFWFGRNTLTESDVRAFYAAQLKASEAMDAPALCAMLSQDFQEEGIVSYQGRTQTVTQDRDGACRNATELMSSLQQLSARTGGRFAADTNLTIISIDVAPGGKQAVVKTRSMLHMGPIAVSARATDTVVRRRGKMQVTTSKSVSWTGANS